MPGRKKERSGKKAVFPGVRGRKKSHVARERLPNEDFVRILRPWTPRLTGAPRVIYMGTFSDGTMRLFEICESDAEKYKADWVTQGGRDFRRIGKVGSFF